MLKKIKYRTYKCGVFYVQDSSKCCQIKKEEKNNDQEHNAGELGTRKGDPRQDRNGFQKLERRLRRLARVM